MGEIIKISKFKNNLVHFLIINFSSEIFFLTRISEYINWFGRKWLSYERETGLYIILGVVKRNPLFFHSISCKNNGFLFTTPNI